MKGTIYSAGYIESPIVTFENGYVYSTSPNFWEDGKIIGSYDTNSTGKRNVYVGSSKWNYVFIGTIKEDCAYMCPSYNMPVLYTKDNYILDTNRHTYAKFEGYSKDALCACLVCIYLELIPLDKPKPVTQHSSSNSNTKPDVIVGGATYFGCGGIIFGVLASILGIILGIYGTYALWTNILCKTMEDGNILGLLFGYISPIIAILYSIYNVAENHTNPAKLPEAFRLLFYEFYDKNIAICIVAAMISIPFEILIYSQPWYYIFSALTVYCFIEFIAFVPYIVGSFILYIVLLMKNA